MSILNKLQTILFNSWELVKDGVGWIENLSIPIYHFLNKMYLLELHPSFLSDVTAFNSAIIGLWIPLSISIIARISERYSSDVIISSFEDRWQNIWLPRLLLVNLLLTVILRCFMPDGDISITERLISWASLLLFVISVLILYSSINMVKDYTYKIDFILNGLFKNAEEIIK